MRADHRETRDPLPEALAVTGPGPHPGTPKETADGRLRYALPTLVVTGPAGHRLVPGRQPLESCLAAVAAVAPAVRPAVQHPSPDDLLAWHRSLSGPDWALLAPGCRPPAQAVRTGTGNGPLWLHPAEAAASPWLPVSPAEVADQHRRGDGGRSSQ